MRCVYPEKIEKLIYLIAPYTVYMKGKGRVLRDDAPPEIIEAKKELDKYHEEFKRY